MKRKKNVKRSVCAVAAALCLCLASVSGTLAWLHTESGTVKNTFVPGQYATLKLIEHTPVADADFNYTIPVATEDTEISTFTDYVVVPGASIAKDPQVSVNFTDDEHPVPSYLYVKVLTDDLPDTTEAPWWTPASGWTALGDTYPGVYYYSTKITSDTGAIPLITDSKLTIPGTFDPSTVTEGTTWTLEFQAFLAQATSGDGTPAGVYAANFVSA